MKIVFGFLACVVAAALVLVANYGVSHLTINPGAVAIVLSAIALGICVAALAATGILRLATGTTLAQSWWPSLIVVALIVLGGLYMIEVAAAL